MTNPTQRARVQKAIGATLCYSSDPALLADAAIEALAEPTPVVRSHKCANGVTITYEGDQSLPWSDGQGARKRLSWVIPADISDDDLAACLALRGDAKPSWWVNVFETGNASMYKTEAVARMAAKEYGENRYLRIAVPVYDHPPVPRAPQSETREVIGHAVLRRDGNVTTWGKGWSPDAGRKAALDYVKFWCGGGTVVELLRGNEVKS